MAKEDIYGKQEECIMDNGQMIKCMVKDLSSMKMYTP